MKQKEYILNDWSVGVSNTNPFIAPELKSKCLSGRCPERSKDIRYEVHEDLYNRMITTSAIVKIEGRKITTKSGSIYILGTVDPSYVEYLKTIGKELDNDNPIKWI